MDVFSVFSGHAVYWLGLLRRSDFLNRVGSGLTWAATVLGLTGLFVALGRKLSDWRRRRPYPGVQSVRSVCAVLSDHRADISEARYQARQMGAFVLVVISAAVGFIPVVHLRPSGA